MVYLSSSVSLTNYVAVSAVAGCVIEVEYSSCGVCVGSAVVNGECYPSALTSDYYSVGVSSV